MIQYFYLMTDKLRWLTFLISSSLFSIIGLQAYYAYTYYLQRTEDFNKDINKAFETALDETNEHRLRKINSLFAVEISDTNKVKLAYEEAEDGPQLIFINAETDYKTLSKSLEKKLNKPAKQSDLIKLAVEHNWQLLKNESILYWTQEIGDNLKAYTDSISISKEVLSSNMEKELKKLEIYQSFSFIRNNSAYKYDTGNKGFKVKMLPVKLEGESLISVKIENPHYEILKRSSVLLSLNVIALTLVIFSFYYLYKLLKKHKRLSELKDDFIDNVTHELITPTATLSLALETIGKHESGHRDKYVKIAQQHASRIEELVDQIVKASFNDEKQLNLDLFSLNELYQQIISYLETSSEKRVIINASLQEDITILTNREYLKTVLLNLLNNAVKYGDPNNPKIEICLMQSSTAVEICIKDNGKGIPKAHHELIFEKFHRVPSDTHEVKGLGIGLYHSRRLIRKISEKLCLKSLLKQGVYFV